ncbi:hypothetical protein FHT78_005252 [Rhizobium sp. BK196]|nr:hypothetical protein [Rhizobium sp. BK196]
MDADYPDLGTPMRNRGIALQLSEDVVAGRHAETFHQTLAWTAGRGRANPTISPTPFSSGAHREQRSCVTGQ